MGQSDRSQVKPRSTNGYNKKVVLKIKFPKKFFQSIFWIILFLICINVKERGIGCGASLLVMQKRRKI